jgi:ribokinase
VPDVVVVGSINQDIVVQVPAPPGPGETVLADAVSITPGGKGANQAVAAARAGASVAMVGRVGDAAADAAGPALKAGLAEAGVDVSGVRETPAVPSGRAFITVTPDGENTIVVAAGANASLTADDVDACAGLLSRASVVVTQLEIPREVTGRLATVCADHGVPLILNLAPAAKLPPGLLARVTVLVVNEHEAAFLLGEPVRPGGAEAAARRLLAVGPSAVALTLGAAGAVWCARGPASTGAEGTGAGGTGAGGTGAGGTGAGGTGADGGRVPAPEVRVVDTTGAGDAFVGALAARIAAGEDLHAATAFAVRVASEATTTRGAQRAAGDGGQPTGLR